jgi:hypothetical protein
VRAMSSALPQLLRFTREIISGANLPHAHGSTERSVKDHAWGWQGSKSTSGLVKGGVPVFVHEPADA